MTKPYTEDEVRDMTVDADGNIYLLNSNLLNTVNR